MSIEEEEVVEVFLLDDNRIKEFYSLSAEDKIKVIRLGLAFYSEGIKHLQKWNNIDWENSIKSIEQQNKIEQDRLLEKIRINETQFNDYVHTSKIRQDALAKEIGDNERMRCSSEIQQLRSQNESLTQQIERFHVNMHKLSSDYDDRREKNLCEQRNYYENKISALECRVEEIRKEKDTVIEKFSQYTHNSSVRGRDGEEWVYCQLNMTFPKGDIEDTHTQPGRGDFILRQEGMTMMIEAKNYSRNVQKAEIDQRQLERIAGINEMKEQGLVTDEYALAMIARHTEAYNAEREAVNGLTEAQLANSGALQEYISGAQEYLNDTQGRIAEIAGTIEQGISSAIMGLVNGTMTATEAFHNFFKSTLKEQTIY